MTASISEHEGSWHVGPNRERESTGWQAGPSEISIFSSRNFLVHNSQHFENLKIPTSNFLKIMILFVEVQGIGVNKFTFWLHFKIIMDFELEFLEGKEIWKCFEFLRASKYLGKFQEIHQKFSLDEVLSYINLYGTTCTDEFEDPFACGIWQGLEQIWEKFKFEFLDTNLGDLIFYCISTWLVS
jgi:hypothetical protein